MTDKPEDGGPVYPGQRPVFKMDQSGNYDCEGGLTPVVSHYASTTGLTIRQFYAAHSPISFQDAMSIVRESQELQSADIWDVLARIRFKYADAMIKAEEGV